MAAELILCVTQKEVETPYQFNITGIKVYSFEEALYHTYHYWKESLDDFLSLAFIEWVREELEEKYLASRLEELVNIRELSDRLTGFLSVTDYLDKERIAAIQSELLLWEKRLEWEKLKEMADFLMAKGEHQKAYLYYKRALQYGDNIEIFNNIGIALMRMELYPEAVFYLAKAYTLDKDNIKIIINYIEALIYNKEYERAFKYLRKAEKYGENSLVYYLYGVLCVEKENYQDAVGYINKAISMGYDNSYYYTLGDIYCKMRKFPKALDALENIRDKNVEFYIRQAEIYAAYDDFGAAVKAIEQAIVNNNKDNCRLWTLLAMYHRLNYDLEKAELAIIKAVTLDNNDRHTKLEHARLKKAQGKTRDYQTVLAGILQSFKREYRKITEIE